MEVVVYTLSLDCQHTDATYLMPLSLRARIVSDEISYFSTHYVRSKNTGNEANEISEINGTNGNNDINETNVFRIQYQVSNIEGRAGR